MEVNIIGTTLTTKIEVTIFFPNFTLSFTLFCFLVFRKNNVAKNTKLVKK